MRMDFSDGKLLGGKNATTTTTMRHYKLRVVCLFIFVPHSVPPIQQQRLIYRTTSPTSVTVITMMMMMLLFIFLQIVLPLSFFYMCRDSLHYSNNSSNMRVHVTTGILITKKTFFNWICLIKLKNSTLMLTKEMSNTKK